MGKMSMYLRAEWKYSGCRVVNQCAVNVWLVLFLDTETVGNGGISRGLDCVASKIRM